MESLRRTDERREQELRRMEHDAAERLRDACQELERVVDGEPAGKTNR